MISGGGRILDIIKPTIEYDIQIVSSTVLQARTEMTTEGSDNNFIIIFEDRALSSELSNILEDFKSMTVDDDDIEEPQLKKRKRNKYHYTENIIHGF